MEEKDRSDTIAVHPVESGTLPLRQHDQAQDQESEQQQDYRGSDEPLFFTYRAKNKVGILVCVPFRKPFPVSPPEPIAIFDWFTL